MSHFFNPVFCLQILKNLEMLPSNRGTATDAFKDIPHSNAYGTFLKDNDLIDFDGDNMGITNKGRILLRQAEILVFESDKKVA